MLDNSLHTCDAKSISMKAIGVLLKTIKQQKAFNNTSNINAFLLKKNKNWWNSAGQQLLKIKQQKNTKFSYFEPELLTRLLMLRYKVPLKSNDLRIQVIKKRGHLFACCYHKLLLRCVCACVCARARSHKHMQTHTRTHPGPGRRTPVRQGAHVVHFHASPPLVG